MAIGSALYAPLGVPALLGLEWSAVSGWAWLMLVYSAVFALVVAYLIWYTAVQRVGNTRTSIYSNVVPLVAMAVAAVALDEPVTARKIAGAAAILGRRGLHAHRVAASGRYTIGSLIGPAAFPIRLHLRYRHRDAHERDWALCPERRGVAAS